MQVTPSAAPTQAVQAKPPASQSRTAVQAKPPTLAADGLQTSASRGKLAPAPASLKARWQGLDSGHRGVLLITGGLVVAAAAVGGVAARKAGISVLKGIGIGAASGFLSPTLLFRGEPLFAAGALFKRH